MGVGLISLQVAENKRRRATFLITTTCKRSDSRIETPEPALAAQGSCNGAVSLTNLEVQPPETYDRQAWCQLIQSDLHLSRLASVLADYGKHYVDELAKGYLATPDKERLPEIIHEIIRGAKSNASPCSIAQLVTDERPSTSAGEPNSAGGHLDKTQNRLLIAASDSTATPATSWAEIYQKVPGRSAFQKVYTAVPEPVPGIRTATITSTDHDPSDLDDNLTESKFAPGAAFLRKS